MKKGLLLAALITCGAVFWNFSSSCAAPIISFQPSYESDFVTRVNAERSMEHLAALSVDSELAAVARAHSLAMAQKDSLFHNSHLTSDVHGWLDIGENVGVGGSVESIHADFMDSPSHQRNILWKLDNRIGVGVTWKNGELFVTEVFARRRVGGGQPAVISTVDSAWKQLIAAGAISSDATATAPAAPTRAHRAEDREPAAPARATSCTAPS